VPGIHENRSFGTENDEWHREGDEGTLHRLASAGLTDLTGGAVDLAPIAAGGG
jgi:hypothetical protein